MKKNLFSRLFIGIKKGVMTPTLPDNILKIQSNPLIRILRVLGGLSIIILLGNRKLDYSLHIYIIYLLLFIGFLFLVYHIIISYYRLKNIFKILTSEDLDIRNSPFDRLATLVAKAVFCAKGACETAQPVALSLGLMLGADEVIKAGGRDPIFAPFLASILIPVESPTARTVRLLNKSIAELNQNSEDRSLVDTLTQSFRSAQIRGGLTPSEHEELRQQLKERAKELDDNRDTIIGKINEELKKLRESKKK